MAGSDSGRLIEGPRSARPEDLRALFETLNAVHRSERHKKPTIERDWAHVYTAENLENVLVMTAGRTVVAAAAVWPNDVRLGPARLRVGGVNLVATLPEYRRRGLGGRIMAAVHARMRRLGCHVGLLGTNIPEWYRRQSWEWAGQMRSYHLDRGNIALLPSLPAGLRTRAATDADLAEVVGIHNQEHLGGIRTSDVFRQTLQARGAPSLTLAERGGTALAYLMAGGRSAREWAGPPEIVAGLVRAWFERLDDPTVPTTARDARSRPLRPERVDVVAPASGHAFGAFRGTRDLLDDRRIPFDTVYAGMMYIVDARAILDVFGRTAIAVEERDSVFRVRCGKDKETLTRPGLAKMLFGPERVSPLGAGLLPLPFHQWPIEHV